MSMVTSACLYVSYARPEVEEAILAPLPEDVGGGQFFRKVPDDVEGGSKVIQADIYLAGFNYVLPSLLVKHLSGILGDGEAEAVLVLEMETDGIEVYRFGDLDDEVEQLRRCVRASLDDARAALNLLDRDVAYDYVDNIRYNAERTLGEV